MDFLSEDLGSQNRTKYKSKAMWTVREGQPLVDGEGGLDDAGLANGESPMPALGKVSKEINGEASLGYLVSRILFEDKT